MKVILTTQGQIVEERELIAVLDFPELILCNGHLYRLCGISPNLSSATYTWIEYFLLASTPVEAESEKVMAQRWELSHD